MQEREAGLYFCLAVFEEDMHTDLWLRVIESIVVISGTNGKSFSGFVSDSTEVVPFSSSGSWIFLLWRSLTHVIFL